MAAMDRRTFVKKAAATSAVIGVAAAGGTFAGCASPGAKSVSALKLTPDSKPATNSTATANKGVYSKLDFSDEREREFATRGLIEAPESLEIKDASGKLVWSQDAYAFVEGDAPDTANPSLWRNTQLNHAYGLFEVMDGIYQVRGYDVSNITFVAGDTGWIVFDPLMCVECAQAAFALVTKHLGERPIMAVIMSHSHVDHYGGIKGIISEEEVAARNVAIIAPEGFVEHAVSENVYAGTAMGRRAGYQYGTLLTPGAEGSLAIGIGMSQPKGTISFILPNDIIQTTGETRVIDGVTMEFQMTPGTEAPAEMNTWFPELRALWLAENCTGTLHNLYTLRGAQVRDGNAWARYIMEARARYGQETEVTFQSHNWPHWGNAEINEYLVNTAAVYKFINDQSLMYLNQGYTDKEIAHMIQLPEALEKTWYTRQYYGTVAHDARAVYQRFMGFYDANPVNLNALPPAEEAAKLASYLGNSAEVLSRAQKDFEAGEYQWVAQITNALVFADPQNDAARLLCADALEQLAYQAESGTWRNVYLSGAKELREGMVRDEDVKVKGSVDLLTNMTVPMLFDYIGISLDANAAADLNMVLNFAFTDDDPYCITIKAGTVLYEQGVQAADADATLTMPRKALLLLLSKDASANQAIQISGDQDVLDKLMEHVVAFDYFFNIVEP